jgi:hypothetical protein
MAVAPVLGPSMRSVLSAFALLLTIVACPARAETYYLVVGGLGGESRYDESFAQQARSLAQSASRSLGGDERVTLLSGEVATRDAVVGALEQLAGTLKESDAVAIFLIGHGSFDGEQYKLNLPGPDIDGDALRELFAALPSRQQVIVNMSSASGAVLQSWAADGRTLITATKSGGERNATRFADAWAQALGSDEADANKNGAITVQEAFDFTARKVTDSFEGAGLLATEHAELVGDDVRNFNIALLSERVAATEELRGLLDQLESLEGQIAALRGRRDEMDNDAYLDELQDLLLELALVQREIDAARGTE